MSMKIIYSNITFHVISKFRQATLHPLSILFSPTLLANLAVYHLQWGQSFLQRETFLLNSELALIPLRLFQKILTWRYSIVYRSPQRFSVYEIKLWLSMHFSTRIYRPWLIWCSNFLDWYLGILFGFGILPKGSNRKPIASTNKMRSLKD